MPLPTDIEVGDPFHETIHNVTNAFTNETRDLADAVTDQVADLVADVALTGGTGRYYGDSWSAGFGLPDGDSYMELAAEEHGISAHENVAVPGSTAASVGTLMISAGLLYTWTAGDAELVAIGAGINDSRYSDLSLPANLPAVRRMRHSLRLACALALGQERVAHTDPSITYAGLWIPTAYNWSSTGVTINATQFPNSSASIAFEGEEISVVLGGLYTETTAVVDFYLDGIKVRTTRLHDDWPLYPAETAYVSLRPERFTGLTPGPHTLKVVKADSGIDHVYLDSYIVPAADPPLVVLCKEPPLPADTYDDFPPWNNGNAASTKVAGQVVDDVATEFPGVRLCTLPELVPVVDYQADLIHPDAGGRDKLQAALSAVLAPPTLTDRMDDAGGRPRSHRAAGVPIVATDVARFTGVLLAEYKVPPRAVKLRIRALGSAGGGGSGRRGAAGTVRCGGGAGSGAGYCEVELNAYGLPETLYVTALNGGAGGAAVTADDTNGNDGVNGSASYVVRSTAGLADEGFYLAFAPGGVRGRGGTAATGLAGAAVPSLAGLSGVGGVASTTGLAGTTPLANGYNGTGQGGGSGAGISAANAQAAGGAGWWSGLFLTAVAAPAAGAAGGGNGGSGVPVNRTQGFLRSEASGAGGGSNLAGPGGAGGAGGRGSGGGGGAASVNGSASGAGGAGGDGFVEITAFLA